MDKLNVNGGAISIGHPFGMTGSRLTGTLANEMAAPAQFALWRRQHERGGRPRRSRPFRSGTLREMRYKGRVDWFIGVSMFVGIVAPVFIAITQNLPWMSIASVIAAALVFGISYPQWYETRPDALIIRSGLTTRLIRYAQIEAVRPSSDNRIAIDYRIRRQFLIAPQNAQGFMDDIAGPCAAAFDSVELSY